jgi:hypothetical protein
MARRARTKRWVFIGVLAVGTVAAYVFTREPVIPTGVVVPDLIPGPMTPLAAAAILKTVNGSAQVEAHGADLTVKIAAATFPERRDGQLALAQQYARADAIVEGRKRAISFLDPQGTVFARANPATGVSMAR